MRFEPEGTLKNASKLAVIEPFVAAEEAAEFLGMTRRRILDMARKGEIPGHPVGYGNRKTWRFRLSELAGTIEARKPAPLPVKRSMIDGGSSRQPNRRN
jgi:excisionase family DNA binding protein